MIVLLTDFGVGGPYVGQMRRAIQRIDAAIEVLELFNDLPPFRPISCAYLLPAYIGEFDAETVFLCVVDPGVGSMDRAAVALHLGSYWFVGPDNGIFDRVIARLGFSQGWRLTPPATGLSATFHGRDLFAPAAARIACGERPAGSPYLPAVLSSSADARHRSGPEELDEVVYVDRFGNLVTGRRSGSVSQEGLLEVGGRLLGFAHHYAQLPAGQAFWYSNANGLVEIAVNQGRADQQLGLAVGDKIRWQSNREAGKG